MKNLVKKYKFITADNRSYIKMLAKHLDIEFTSKKNVRKSKKPALIWHPYVWVRSERDETSKKWKWDLYRYCQKHNKTVYVVERGALPNCIFLDKNGFNVDSSSYDESNWNYPLKAKELIKVNKYIEGFVNDTSSLEAQKSGRMTKSVFRKKLNLKSKYKKVVFVPMQTVNDSVTILWCDWVKSVLNFQEILIDIAKKNQDILFLVKKHPNGKNYKIKESIVSNIKIVNLMNYKDCIKYSDSVLCINSGVGLQAMMWQKPVILVGSAFYQFKGINYKASNKEDIVKLIHQSNIPDMEKIKRFIYFLKFKFYTTCIMDKHAPIEITRIVFEAPNSKEKITITSKQRR